MSLKKCNFAHAELRALGRRVSGLQIAVDPNKMAAVVHWERPKNIRQLQSFLGFINYHRAHLKDLAKLLRPLSQLLSKDVAWEWTEARENAFQAAKKALLDPAVLAIPNWDLPFKLYIDASFEGLGAELAQVQENKERPIAFISRRLKPAEERYGATQLECLGLVWSLDKLYYYLDGAVFEVFTDCQAIKALITVKNPNRHMLRWQLAIQEHRGHMTIVHRPGVENKNADGLSRCALPNDSSNPAADLTDEVALVYAISMVEMNDEWFKQIRAGYEEDENLSRVLTAVKANTPDALQAARVDQPRQILQELEQGRFFSLDDILYRKDGLTSVIVVADIASKQSLLHACHDAVTAGHFGVERTLQRLKTYVWWPNMYTDTKAYVESCDTCQKAKRTTGKVPGLMMKIDTPKRPWEVIHMDFVTALPLAGRESYNTVLVIACRATKRAKFIATHDALDGKSAAMLYWEHCFADFGLPRIIISDRDPKFTGSFWKSLFSLLGTRLNMSTAHHPQTDGLAERTIQTLIDTIRRYCAFGLKFRDADGFRHDWVSLLPALEQAYNSSKHAVTGKAPFELEKGWTPRLPISLAQGPNAVEMPIEPAAGAFAAMIEEARKYAGECVDAAFEDAKKRWDQHHSPPKVEVGDSVLVSTRHFAVIGSRKLKDAFVGPFVVERLVNDNAVRLLLTPPYDRKHPVFPVALLKIYKKHEGNAVAQRKQPPAFLLRLSTTRTRPCTMFTTSVTIVAT